MSQTSVYLYTVFKHIQLKIYLFIYVKNMQFKPLQREDKSELVSTHFLRDMLPSDI